MKLYHGSSVIVAQPDVQHSRLRVDFGAGFYTTALHEQARDWCGKFLREGKAAYISCYTLDEAAFQQCKVLSFDTYSEAWLDFVSENRSGNYKGESYDFILGPVANDDVYRTFTLYTAGLLTKEQTLEALKVKKLYDQLVFSTETALSYLRFIGTVPEEEM